MKTIFIILLLFICSHTSFSKQKTPDTSCHCIATAQLKVPVMDQDDEKSGTVIMEFDSDSMGIFSNPVVIQSLGIEYDKEALRFVNEYIASWNRCIRACRFHKISAPVKLRHPITFLRTED